MIEVKNLVKTFDGFTALDSATLTVPRGGGPQRRRQVHAAAPHHRGL